MSLYVCNGKKCEPTTNCAIRYPGVGDCHLTLNPLYAKRPIRKYYQIIELSGYNVDFIVEHAGPMLGISKKSLLSSLGMSSQNEFYRYCDVKGYSSNQILTRKLNDLAKTKRLSIRFAPSRTK